MRSTTGALALARQFRIGVVRTLASARRPVYLRRWRPVTMLDLYTWTTPNGRKISIMLEECRLPYHVIPIDLGKEEQLKPEFLALNPNHKIPAIVDHDAKGGPKKLFESGAILIYLAEKTGKLLPADEPARSEVIQWLMFQMSSVGPMLGQTGHFINDAPEKIPYAIQRFVNE